MTKHLFLSVAAAALIAGSGLASAQGPAGGGAGAATGGAPAAERSGPASGGAAERGPAASDRAPAGGDQMNRDAAPRGEPGMKATQGDTPRDGGDRTQRAQDNAKDKDGMKGNNTAQSKDGMSKDGKAADRDGRPGDRDGNRNADRNDGRSSQTSGQAGAGGKLTTEQRSRVTTVIKQQNIRPETNVNFSISVGTRVPREVRFHPLPTEIISVYPDWRGYEFFLVGNDIIVVNPRTLEIVAVLDA